MQNQKHPIKERILRLPEVIKTTGLSRSTIYSHIKKELFPKHINLGARCVGWIESEIDDWIQSRIKKSRS
ncbi:MAG: AlpA family transcriptional regulator [Alphaproteobacteria bacterium]|nr:AlpA family transcriptional regulator [Alphaproteobacteria bacterium]